LYKIKKDTTVVEEMYDQTRENMEKRTQTYQRLSSMNKK